MAPKDLKTDSDAYMVNLGPHLFLGYALILTAVISAWFHHFDIFQGGIWQNVFAFSPVLVGAGVMVLVHRWIFDPKWIIGIGLVAALVFFVLVVM
ncbi:MAG: hypothetical protein PHZ19_10420 [Candidatus Thermoplasmatota archaeon]|nr:hypothetical protein [Candidatus Thermoplasmatota archaeon]